MINSYKQTLWNYIQAVETENFDNDKRNYFYFAQ